MIFDFQEQIKFAFDICIFIKLYTFATNIITQNEELWLIKFQMNALRAVLALMSVRLKQ